MWISSFICFIGYLMYFIFHTLKFHDPFILLKGRSLRSIRFWVLKDASLKKFWFSMSPIRKSKAVFFALLNWSSFIHLWLCWKNDLCNTKEYPLHGYFLAWVQVGSDSEYIFLNCSKYPNSYIHHFAKKIFGVGVDI